MGAEPASKRALRTYGSGQPKFSSHASVMATGSLPCRPHPQGRDPRSVCKVEPGMLPHWITGDPPLAGTVEGRVDDALLVREDLAAEYRFRLVPGFFPDLSQDIYVALFVFRFVESLDRGALVVGLGDGARYRRHRRGDRQRGREAGDQDETADGFRHGVLLQVRRPLISDGW